MTRQKGSKQVEKAFRFGRPRLTWRQMALLGGAVLLAAAAEAIVFRVPVNAADRWGLSGLIAGLGVLAVWAVLRLIKTENLTAFRQTEGGGETAVPGETDETLSEITARLRDAEILANIGHWELNLETGKAFWSRQMRHIFGVPQEVEASPQTLFSIVHEDDRDMVQQAMEQALSGKKPYDVQYRIVRAGGDERILHSQARIKRTDDGRPLRMLGIAKDITRQAQTEAALRESEEKFRIVFEYQMDTIALLDRDFRHIAVNRSPVGNPEEMIGKTIHDSLPPDLVRQRIPQLQQVLATGEPLRVETVIKTVQGETRWLDTILTPYYGDAGEVAGIISQNRDITERKQAEAALRASESRLKEAQRLARIGNWELDLTANALYWSDEVYRIFELEPQQFDATYEAFLNNIHPDDRDFVNKAYVASVNNRTPYNIIHRLLLKEGTVKFVNERCETFYDDAGKAIRSIGTVQDITEQIRAEKALRASEERFRAIVETTNDWIWEIDANGVYTYASPAVKTLLGYEPESIIGKTPLDLMPPEEAERVTGQFQPLLSNHLPIERLENVNMHQDGRRIVLETSGVPIFGADGRFAGYRGIDRDITERVQTREILQRQAQRLAALREIDQDILVAQSPQSVAQTAIDKMRGLIPFLRASLVLFYFETNEGEIIASSAGGESSIPIGIRMPLKAMAISDKLFRGDADMQADILTMDNPPLAVRSLQTEGMRSYVSVPLILQSELIGALYMSSDRPNVFATEDIDIAREIADQLAIAIQQIRLRMQVQRHAAELEERVAERTADLNARIAEVEQLNRGMINLLEDLQIANQRVTQTARQMEQANAELESFAYSVSHDLRAPLRHISGFVNMLRKREGERLDETSARYLRIVRESADKMGQLIDDLLAFSRTSRQELRTQPVDVNGVVAELQRELSPELSERDIVWQIGYLPAVTADPALLRQVWLNLLDNAIKYTSTRSQAQIEIDAMPPDETGAVTFYIRDNGVGFDEQYAHKLFGVFQRLHRDDEFTGTGIGLAIVRRIIHRHGGRTWAEGKVDEGATFYFTLQKAGA